MNDQPALLKRWGQTGIPFLIFRLALGGMFLYMGAAKALDPQDFIRLINEYRMVPQEAWRVLNLIAVTLPWVEMLCGLLLIAGLAIRGSALLLFVMLTGFTVAVTIRAVGIYHHEVIRFCDIKFDCGCGAGEVYICHKIPENLGLMLLSLLVMFSRSRRFCLRRAVSRTAGHVHA